MVLPGTLGGVNPVLVLAVALAVDALVGDPPALARWHPVALLGKLLAALERLGNRGGDLGRRIAGTATAVGVAGLSAGLAGLLARALAGLPGGWLGEALLVAVLLSGASLARYVRPVAAALAAGDIPGARAAVASLVSRDTASLDTGGIARAGLESLAENASDGLIAPAFWYVLLGLPGLAAYKAINTADAMLGYRSAGYGAFGWASARLDDAANWPPARLTVGLIALAAALTPGCAPRAALRASRRDGPRHASPNAGRVEAALAGALHCALGVRGGAALFEPGGHPASPADLHRGLALYGRLRALLASLTWGAGLALIAALGWPG